MGVGLFLGVAITSVLLVRRAHLPAVVDMLHESASGNKPDPSFVQKQLLRDKWKSILLYKSRKY